MPMPGIMIVSDPIQLPELGERLAALGYGVAAEASSAPDAARLAGTLAPNLVLLVAEGPGGMAPAGACQAIRKATDAPIVLVLGDDQFEAFDHSLETGTVSVLIAPFTDNQLRATLEAASRTFRDAETRRLECELDVHKTELNQQVDELREARVSTESLRDKYFKLYDLAPVGYLTVSDQGLVTEANSAACAMAGLERSRMIGKPFSRFLQRDSLPAWHGHLGRLFRSGDRQECEVSLLPGPSRSRLSRSSAWSSRCPTGARPP